MSKFLTGASLTDKIFEIVDGNNVKCAVAYWGDHRLKVTKDCKIVCDIVNGSTSGDTLKKLGAPNNKNLKHIENFHAKVYISDRGVIVCSANASAGGLDCEERPARLLEAGIFHKANGNIWKQSTDWFDEIFSKASDVDQAAVDLANKRYRRPAGDHPTNFEGMTVLQQIASDPDHFSRKGVGFIICRTSAEEHERKKAAKQAVKSGAVEGMAVDTLVKWDGNRSFIEWPQKYMKELNTHFIEFFFYRNGRGKAVLAHTYVHRFDGAGDGGTGHFYTRAAGPAITLPNGFKFPTGGKDALSDDDWRILLQAGRLLQDANGDARGIFHAHDFSCLLRQAFEAGA